MDLLGYQRPWRKHGVLGWLDAHRNTQGGVFFDHLLPQHKGIYLPMMANPNNVTVIPMRHPRLTRKSWMDRKKPMSVHDVMWRLLVNEVAPLMPFFVPIDSDERGWFLEQLETRLGRELKTKWKPQGVKHSNSALKYTDLEETDLESEIKPFLDRFYAC